MRKAGGIIAIIAGIFGVFAALLTLVVGGVGSAFQANNAKLVVWLGWGGLLFSFLTIVLGAVCTSARSRMPAAFLIFAAFGGIVLGGTAVAICMALALVGGLIAIFSASPTGDLSASPTRDGSRLPLSSSPADQGSELANADEVIARYLKNREQVEAVDQSRRSSAPASGFGKRRAGATDR